MYSIYSVWWYMIDIIEETGIQWTVMMSSEFWETEMKTVIKMQSEIKEITKNANTEQLTRKVLQCNCFWIFVKCQRYKNIYCFQYVRYIIRQGKGKRLSIYWFHYEDLIFRIKKKKKWKRIFSMCIINDRDKQGKWHTIIYDPEILSNKKMTAVLENIKIRLMFGNKSNE